MNRSSLKHSPFIRMLMATACGWSFGTKPTAEDRARKSREASSLLSFLAPPKYAMRVGHHVPVNTRRARRKFERENRHAAQRRMRDAA